MKYLKYFLIIAFIFLSIYLLKLLKKKDIKEIKKSEFSEILETFDKYNDTIKPKKITIPVYYINMDKYEDRRKYMEEHLKKYTDNYQRIKGFNGYLIENKENDIVDGVQFFNDYAELTKAEIGCTMSHLMAIKKAYDNGDNIALILEDDTNVSIINTLDFDFPELFKNAPENWEMLKCFHMEDDALKNLTIVSAYKDYNYLLEDNINHSYSTVGYVINRKGMEKILNYACIEHNTFYIKKINSFPTKGPADVFLYEIVNTYNIEPSIFFPNNSDFKSTIHDSHTNSHIMRSSRVLKNHYEKIKIKQKTRDYEDLYSNLFENTIYKPIKMPIYFINMDKNPERRHFMENQLQNVSNNYQRIRGFNGYSINNINSDTVDGITFYNDYDDLSKSEVGCTLSHLIAIKTSYERGDEMSLILEDDAVLSLFNLINFDVVKNAPQDWEIIQLYYVNKEIIGNLEGISVGEYKYRLHDNKNYVWSTAGYIINRKGMEKIINFSYSNHSFYIRNIKNCHGVADEYIYDLAKTYIIDPCVLFTNNISLTSTINNDKIGMQIDRSIDILKEYMVKKEKDWSFLDKVVFINLESRPDRLFDIQNELYVIPREKVLRFNGILDSPGHIGCSKSHIASLEIAIANNWKNVLIVEDDAMWNKYDKGYNRLLYLIKKNPHFDVITLGNTEVKFDKNTGKLFSGVTCTAYLVNQHYYQTLLKNFKEGLDQLLITKTIEDKKDRLPYEKKYCIDQYWKHLQAKDNWFIVNPALMIQRPGKSSIIDANHGEDVDYTSLFNL